MNYKVIAPALSLFLMAAGSMASAQAPRAQNVAAVVDAQKAAYAVKDATNGCPFATADILGWPASLVRECIYQEDGLKGYVLLLEIKPEVIAGWIETSCAQVLMAGAQCFKTV